MPGQEKLLTAAVFSTMFAANSVHTERQPGPVSDRASHSSGLPKQSGRQMPAEKVQHGGPGRVDDVPARHECCLHVWQQIRQAPVDGMKGHRGARSRMATGHRRIAVDRGRTSAAASWPVGSRTPENRPRRGNGRLFSIAQGTHAKKRDSGIDEQAEPNYWRLGRELTSLRVCFRRMPAASVLGIVGQDAHSNPSAGLGRCSSADGPKNTPRRELY